MTEKTVTLSFAELILIDDFLIEIIPHEDVEINDTAVKEYHEFYQTLGRQVGVLINRKNHYSYTFEGLMEITKTPNVTAAAFLTANLKNTNYIISTIKQCNFTMQAFKDRKDAIDWLNKHRP